MRPLALTIALAPFLACTSAEPRTPDPTLPDAGPSATCGACAAYGDPEEDGRVDSDALTELSGIAASRARNGVFYVHNDSGDTARFFAIDGKGALAATYDLDGVTAEDIEDVGVGPCPEGRCVYLADIGDNDKKRNSVAIYRVTEPPLADTRLTPQVLRLTYPDGPHNAEALLVSPEGDLVIVEKVTGAKAAIFVVDHEAARGPSATPRKMGELGLPAGVGDLVTGGAFHPCEKRVVLRTYAAMVEYRFEGGIDTIFAGEGRVVPAAREPQGEAVTYTADGRSLVTVGEGKHPKVYASRCAP